ncbi:putative NCS1 nucleoside transporter family protein [Seiridium cardinale]|uniref:NCS1 nucleoside transporter family protein n=1 Tax=Seiridium cardinale TaxID=138064 RepID=A0ABR2XRH0_9PEZI
MSFSSLKKRAELSHGSVWINEDVRPLEDARRTWTFISYHNFWLLINCSIASYLTGSALIPLGLTWWQAVICIVVGNAIATAALLISSLAGAHYNIGFSVLSRAIWGLWGSQFVIWNRIFLSIVWYGFQTWVGGQCVYIILLSFQPDLEKHIPNTLPADTGATTAEFVAYIVFFFASLPFLWVRPHRIEKLFYFASAVTLIFFLVLLIWSLATMGPEGFGSTLDSDTDLPSTGGPGSIAWLMIYGIMSTIGSIAAGILNQNDFSRFSRRPSDAIWGQAIAFPVYSIFTAVVGILVTAATQNRLGGDALWNPPTLMAALLELDNTAGTRAAVFFSGLALTIAQIGTNVPGNGFAGGIDLSAVFPKYINIRRGAFITAIISPAVNPWRLVSTATTFLTVLSGYSVFIAPMTGIMAASYLVVSRQKIKTEDLFHPNSENVYWYSYGVNWRAFAAWIIGVVPILPGFINAVNLSILVPDSVVELYYLNYIYGFLVGGLVFTVLHRVFPAGKLDTFVREAPDAKTLRKQNRIYWNSTLEGSEHAGPLVHSDVGHIVPIKDVN